MYSTVFLHDPAIDQSCCSVQIGCFVLFCLVLVLADTPGGVKRSGLGARACWVMHHSLSEALWYRNIDNCIWYGIPISYRAMEI